MTVRLYRAVSRKEADQALALGKLSTIAGSLEGKWFAEQFDHAALWGEQLARLSGIRQDTILEVEVSVKALQAAYRLPMLDGIGPAVFISEADLIHVLTVREVAS